LRWAKGGGAKQDSQTTEQPTTDNDDSCGTYEDKGLSNTSFWRGPKPTPPFSVIATPFWAQKKQCEKMEPRKIEDVFKAGTQTILADWGWPRGVVFFWGVRGQGVATI